MCSVLTSRAVCRSGFVIAGLAASAFIAGCQVTPPLEESLHGRFSPPSGQTLLIIGQDLGSVADYSVNIPVVPGGITTYTDISEGDHSALLYGLEETVDYGAGNMSGRVSAESFPNSALAIGLHIVDQTGTNLLHMIDGTHDPAIDQLGDFITSIDRPVYLRIGYEFDGPWNHHEPEAYVEAFRYIVDRLRGSGVDNFASVWQSATSGAGTYRDLPFDTWYPGDEYVDWMGTSYFVFDPVVYDAFLEFARSHSKPVMIAEAAPQGFDLADLTYSGASDGLSFEPRTSGDVWNEWYAPFFSFIHENSDVIRAVAYINCDWNEQDMWRPGGTNGYWGDTRVQANDDIKARWLAEIGDPLWLHGSLDLFQKLGYGD